MMESTVDVERVWSAIQTQLAQLASIPKTPKNLKARKELANSILSQMEEEPLFSYVGTDIERLRAYQGLSREIRQYANLRIQTIETTANSYFREWFAREGKEIGVSGIVFTPKNRGIQLGTTMTITYTKDNIEHTMNYYIKTHQHGSTTSASSVQLPDPKELFVYKVLEYAGYGPKTHFFFNPLSPGGLYIATQDLAFTKIPGKTKKFTLFEHLMPEYNTETEPVEYDEARRALVAFDMLSRILCLSDTTTNPGNFGRITHTNIEKWKVLDFRILHAERPDLYGNPDIFAGFMSGNGLYNYEYAAFMRQLFRDSTQSNRKMRMAIVAAQDFRDGKLSLSSATRKLPFPVAMQKAFDEINGYITMHARELGLDMETAQTDLFQYVTAINENFRRLIEPILNPPADFTTTQQFL